MLRTRASVTPCFGFSSIAMAMSPPTGAKHTGTSCGNPLRAIVPSTAERSSASRRSCHASMGAGWRRALALSSETRPSRTVPLWSEP